MMSWPRLITGCTFAPFWIGIGAVFLSDHAFTVADAETPLVATTTSTMSSKDDRASECTDVGDDPYSSGSLVECCDGLEKCIGDYGDPTGRWFYKCAPYCSVTEHNLHFDTTPDYLNIGARVSVHDVADNFYLVMGDQGGCGGCGACCDMQKKVARLADEYVAERKANNPRSVLLFVLLVGDNFYWTGMDPGGTGFQRAWADVYSEELRQVPWFAVLGNHDYGNSDPEMACPHLTHPQFVCNKTNNYDVACGGPRPYSVGKTQYYGSNQLDISKGGAGTEQTRGNFVMPDFAYFYRIPQLDLELIGLDLNWYDRGGIGGNGVDGGAAALKRVCGQEGPVFATLAAIRDASTRLLRERAQSPDRASNVALFSHYPDWFQDNINLRVEFEKASRTSRGSGGTRTGLSGVVGQETSQQTSSSKVFNFYGHTHVQKCITADDTSGECVDFLTGGSGGCCGYKDVPAGFVVISFSASAVESHRNTDDGDTDISSSAPEVKRGDSVVSVSSAKATTTPTQVTECFVPDPRCTLTHYATSPVRDFWTGFFGTSICDRTQDDSRCSNYHAGLRDAGAGDSHDGVGLSTGEDHVPLSMYSGGTRHGEMDDGLDDASEVVVVL